MKRALARSGGSVLIASDSVSDATLIMSMLEDEFTSVHIACDPDQAVADFTAHLPQVLILAFKHIDDAQQYCLGLFRHGSRLHLHPHRTILLCGKEELRRAYQLCRRNLFDDYNLFWPMNNEPQRLPMSVHTALRSLDAAAVSGPQTAELAAAAHHLGELEAQLEQQLALGRERVVAAHGLLGVAAHPALDGVRGWADAVQAQLQPHLHAARVLHDGWAGAPAPAPMVLVVDDDDVARRLIGAVFRDHAYQMVYAASAVEALILLRTIKPALILMDVLMPGMDGLLATREIKAMPEFADVPVMIMTGNSESSVVLDSFKYGASDFIVKPFEREMLLSKVAGALASAN